MSISTVIKNNGFKYDQSSSGSRGFYLIAAYVPKVALVRKGIDGYFEVHSDFNYDTKVTTYTCKGGMKRADGTVKHIDITSTNAEEIEAKLNELFA
jgi:hypothetical protein